MALQSLHCGKVLDTRQILDWSVGTIYRDSRRDLLFAQDAVMVDVKSCLDKSMERQVWEVDKIDGNSPAVLGKRRDRQKRQHHAADEQYAEKSFLHWIFSSCLCWSGLSVPPFF